MNQNLSQLSISAHWKQPITTNQLYNYLQHPFQSAQSPCTSWCHRTSPVHQHLFSEQFVSVLSSLQISSGTQGGQTGSIFPPLTSNLNQTLLSLGSSAWVLKTFLSCKNRNNNAHLHTYVKLALLGHLFYFPSLLLRIEKPTAKSISLHTLRESKRREEKKKCSIFCFSVTKPIVPSMNTSYRASSNERSRETTCHQTEAAFNHTIVVLIWTGKAKFPTSLPDHTDRFQTIRLHCTASLQTHGTCSCPQTITKKTNYTQAQRIAGSLPRGVHCIFF